MKNTAILCNDKAKIAYVYSGGRRERIAAISKLYPDIVTSDSIEDNAEVLKDTEAVFSTWGMPLLTESQLEMLPSLKAVFYAASSVKGFAKPLLDRDIRIVSAWGANAIAVAEFTVAQIILANKGFFRNQRDAKNPELRTKNVCFRGNGNYGETISILGAGQVGRCVIEHLKNYNLAILVFDPFLETSVAEKLNVEKVSLQEAFARGYTISNHLADVPETRGLITEQHFVRMRPNATFMNTGRGATVVEEDLIDVLIKRPDISAVLDVTNPEPPAADSPFYTLPNVVLTSHIAGSLNDEVRRMADCMIDEYLAWESGRQLRYCVTEEMLATTA